MADTDHSIYNLRYNQVTRGMEGFGGGTPQWTPLSVGGGDSFTATSFTSSTGNPTKTSATFVASGVSAAFAMATAGHRVRITSAGDGLSELGVNPVYFALAVDGVPVNAGVSIGVNSTGDVVTDVNVPVALEWIYSPASTASHTYSVMVASEDGTHYVAYPQNSATLVIQEII